MMAALATGLVTNAATASRNLAHASGWAVFAVGAAMILTGAFGVILLRNPVHNALMLVLTLFGVALEFIDESAYFLAAVQIIVYAGAVVILFLFVIMFLGVDRKEAAGPEATKLQKPLAFLLGIVALVEILALSRIDHWVSGASSQAGALNGAGDNVAKLGQSIYTGYLLPFEMTAALLVIAVVAAVVMSRRHLPSASEMSSSHQRRLTGSGPSAAPPAIGSSAEEDEATLSPATTSEANVE
jgi:NADH-quinone oxidoreductase subunit J